MGLPIAGYACSTMVPSKSTAIIMGFTDFNNISLSGCKVNKKRTIYNILGSAVNLATRSLLIPVSAAGNIVQPLLMSEVPPDSFFNPLLKTERGLPAQFILNL